MKKVSDVIVAAWAAVVMLGSIRVSFAADPAATCESSKLGIAAKYAYCRLGAASKAVKAGVEPDYSRCSLDKFADVEAKAGPGVCPSEGDQAALQGALSQRFSDVAMLLHGWRFFENGDGTVTDIQTGLMWEQKTGTPVGYQGCPGAVTCGNVHDVNNAYAWSTGEPWNADGPAFSSFLAELNGASPFAGHADWRLPTNQELEGIVTPGCLSASSPCIDPVFGPTQAGYYWSSMTGYWADVALVVPFYFAPHSNGDFKEAHRYVRAVRSGS